ncbi:unnamed protein product [Notodromas monacha]|uniref:Osteopetrosis-associated transmembrane protein 1 n=1 Tax=Notodromas monacha TaxID=399045 RepID=A0A7R9BQ33_9CRUS|nr:unnamed protein product [Notodromas monacha]CAG0918073.1 unnamed protein product [Notodromas monacha]
MLLRSLGKYVQGIFLISALGLILHDVGLKANPDEATLRELLSRNLIQPRAARCEDAFGNAMGEVASFFQNCLPSNLKPMSICANCGEYFRKGVAAFDTLRDVNCYVKPIDLDNHSETPKFRPDVSNFLQNVSSVDQCFIDNPGDKACNKCEKEYTTAMAFYKELLYESAEAAEKQEITNSESHFLWQLLDARPIRAFLYRGEVLWERSQSPTKSPGGFRLCLDAIHAMNQTRTTWKARGCREKETSTSLLALGITVGAMILLPIFFYLVVFCVSVRRKPFVEAQQKRLRWRYDTLTEDYIDDKVGEER